MKHLQKALLSFILLSCTWIGLSSCGGLHLNNPSNAISTTSSASHAPLTALTVGAYSSSQNGLIALGLNNPNKAFSDGTHLFVADTGNNRVLIYNQIPSTNLVLPDVVLGQPDLSSISLSEGVTSSTLNAPQSVCSSGGKLFVADTQNNRVLVWNSIPTTQGQAADMVLGQTDMYSAGVSVSQTPMDQPIDLVCNSTFLWVLDLGGNVSTFTLSSLTTNAMASPVLTPTGTLTGLALDSAHLLVSTTSNVQIWNSATATTAPSAASPTATITATVGTKSIYSDGTNIWFADSNNRVFTYTGYATATINIGVNTGLTIGESTANGSTGGTSGTLIKSPRGVYSDGTYLYIADAGNNRVLIYTLPTVPGSPTAYSTAANSALGQGSLNLGSANTPIAANLLYTPNQAFTDGTHLIVADTGNNRVLIWNTVPTTSGVNADLVLGQGGSFYTRSSGTDASSGSNVYLSSPRSVYSDGTHLFVADTSNNRVLVWTTFPTSSTSAPNFVLGQSNFTTVTGGTTATTMITPYSVTADSTYLYISDSGNKRLLTYTLNTILTARTSGQAASHALGAKNLTTAGSGIGQSGFTPQGAYSTDSQLFVSDSVNNRVLVWNTIPNGNLVQADLVLGQSDFYSIAQNFNPDGSIGVSPQTTYSPHGMAVIGNSLYLADSNNNRILAWNPIPTSNGQAADSVIGQNSLYSSNLNSISLSPLTFFTPFGLTSYGNTLLITDRDNNRILFNPQ